MRILDNFWLDFISVVMLISCEAKIKRSSNWKVVKLLTVEIFFTRRLTGSPVTDNLVIGIA